MTEAELLQRQVDDLQKTCARMTEMAMLFRTRAERTEAHLQNIIKAGMPYKQTVAIQTARVWLRARCPHCPTGTLRSATYMIMCDTCDYEKDIEHINPFEEVGD